MSTAESSGRPSTARSYAATRPCDNGLRGVQQRRHRRERGQEVVSAGAATRAAGLSRPRRTPRTRAQAARGPRGARRTRGRPGEEPVELGQDHRLGERRLAADLVVDGLPAHADASASAPMVTADQPSRRDAMRRVEDALPRRSGRRRASRPRPADDEVDLVAHPAVRAGPRVRHRRPGRAGGEPSRSSPLAHRRSGSRTPAADVSAAGLGDERCAARPAPHGRGGTRPVRRTGDHAARRRGAMLMRDRSPSTCATHPRIHHAPPGRRYEREQDHPGVAGRQDGRLGVVAQRLVAARGVGVVVAVPLQVVEQHVRRDVVGVPAVPRLDALAALTVAVTDAAAQHPVVLEVVHGLEQRERDRRPAAAGRAARRPEPHAERDPETADMSHALSTSFPIRQGDWRRRA